MRAALPALLVLLTLPVSADAAGPWSTVIKHARKGRCVEAVAAADGAFPTEGTEGKRIKAVQQLSECVFELLDADAVKDPASTVRIAADAMLSAPQDDEDVIEAMDQLRAGVRVSLEREAAKGLADNADTVVAVAEQALRLNPDSAIFRVLHLRGSLAAGDASVAPTHLAYTLEHIHDLRPTVRAGGLLTEACIATIAQWPSLEDPAAVAEDCQRQIRARELREELRDVRLAILAAQEANEVPSYAMQETLREFHHDDELAMKRMKAILAGEDDPAGHAADE